MEYKYQIILFKNKEQKKKIKNFVTHKRASDYFDLLLKMSEEVIFPKSWENGSKCFFEIGLIENTSGSMIPIFLKDELGRQIKVETNDENRTILKISKYNIEEEFVDFSTKNKIDSKFFIKKYLDVDGFKLISKLNNKIVVQNEDKTNLFTLKTIEDSDRFIEVMVSYFNEIKRQDCLFVKDISTIQRKYLYEILVSNGFPLEYLQRYSTTHPVKK